MSLPIPVDSSKIISTLEDRTWRVQIECADGQPYTLQWFREDVARNAAGDVVSRTRTDEFSITLAELQTLAADHPGLQQYFEIPGLVKRLCDDLATIKRANMAPEA